MGKWIKLLNANGDTVCLKYAPGYDRFIDHGLDRTTWAWPLQLAGLATPGTTTWAPLEPTEQSLDIYAEYLSRPSNVALNSANNDKRFISLTDPSAGFTASDNYTQSSSGDTYNVPTANTLAVLQGPYLNWVDAYTLVDLHVVLKTRSTTIGEPIITTRTYHVVAVIQPPGDVHSTEYSQGVSGSRWRIPLTQPLIFDVATPFVGYDMLDQAYDQLEDIFGPF
jgi:hypothetical protein